MTNMKRSLSDSEGSDVECDDMTVGSPSQSCTQGGSDRKKRRGVIEKRRRDRINNSLTELRRLVPTAFEKQGSAKLEKAEILQMTVDHLKLLHSKGMNGYNFDPAALAMDYRSVGFRECAAEVARYLVTTEGMDIQDPLRLRLMSHLQCYSAQRDVAAKSSYSSSFQNWNSVPSHPGLNPQYPAPTGVGSMPPPPPSMISQHGTNTDQLSLTPLSSTGLSSVSCADPVRMTQHPVENSHLGSSMRIPSTASIAPPQVQSISSSAMSQSQAPLHSQFPSVHSNSFHHMSLNVGMISPSGNHPSYSPPTSLSQSLSQSKPYRPWGAELAY